MSFAAHNRESDSRISPRVSVAILAAATLVALLPFLNRAFCVDDPLFLWAGRQIQVHPFDFYGCVVNWDGTPSPMCRIMKNPPAASYYIAATTALAGWSEPALHLAFLLPAIGTIVATWSLARSLCEQPIFAALAVLTAPAFLVASMSIACDTAMVCLWSCAVATWIKGVTSANGWWMAIAALLVALAALTKYFAVSLIPLLAVFTIVRQRRLTTTLLWLVVPAILLAGYEWWTRREYGVGLLSDAAVYAHRFVSNPESMGARGSAAWQTATALSFTGGSFIGVLFLAPWLWPKHGLAAITILVGLAIASTKWISLVQPFGAFQADRSITWMEAVQLGLFTTCGALVLWLAVMDLMKHRDAVGWLLALWILGTFVFAGFLNWTCNVRSVLPMAPALAIILARRLEQRHATTGGLRAWHWGLVLSAEVALMVGWADLCFADSQRKAAREIVASLRPEPATIWFEGHWGFQYYMQADGAKELNLVQPACGPGDFVVVPENNTNFKRMPEVVALYQREAAVPVCPWLSTMDYRVGAGFYTSLWGPFPYVFGPADDQLYYVWRVDSVTAPDAAARDSAAPN